MEYLNTVKTVDPTFKTSVKLHYMALFYRLELFDQGQSLLDSLRHFVINSKNLGEYEREEIKNNIRIYKILFKLKSEPENIDKMSLVELRKIINSTNLVNKKYFLNRADELELIAAQNF